MSDELSRLREMEERLDRIASEDPEISKYLRVRGPETDALDAIVAVLDRARREEDVLLEDLIQLGHLYVRALVTAQDAIERLSRTALH
jgi:hypothetical protein